MNMFNIATLVACIALVGACLVLIYACLVWVKLMQEEREILRKTNHLPYNRYGAEVSDSTKLHTKVIKDLRKGER